MLDCQLAMLSYQSTYALVAGITPQPQGAKHDSIPTYRSFVGEDGRELVVTANTERMWRGMCSALGCAELADDARFCNAHSRLAHRNELWPILEAAFRTKPAADWIEPLQSQGVPVALIKKVPEALADAREAGRGMVMQLEDLDGRSVEVVGNPIKLQGESPLVPRYPPRLGEGAHQVLASWLGKAERDVDLIVASGALQLAHG